MRPLRPFALAVATAALVGPVTAHADEPVRPSQSHPDEYPKSTTRGKIATAGLAITAGFYGAALSASYLWPDAPGADSLRVPVAGPWMALADTGCPAQDPHCKTFTIVIRAVLTTLDGIAQAGGLGVALESVFMPTHKREAAFLPLPARPKERPAPPRPRRQVVAVPFTAGHDAVGLGLVGRF